MLVIYMFKYIVTLNNMFVAIFVLHLKTGFLARGFLIPLNHRENKLFIKAPESFSKKRRNRCQRLFIKTLTPTEKCCNLNLMLCLRLINL